MKFLLNAAYCFVTGHLSCMQTQVRKSAPSRALSQGGRWLPQRRPPILLSSRCPVPAAATPSLNPGHPAPFSAKPFHQVQSTTLMVLIRILAVCFSFVSSAFRRYVPSCLSALSCSCVCGFCWFLCFLFCCLLICTRRLISSFKKYKRLLLTIISARNATFDGVDIFRTCALYECVHVYGCVCIFTQYVPRWGFNFVTNN